MRLSFPDHFQEGIIIILSIVIFFFENGESMMMTYIFSSLLNYKYLLFLDYKSFQDELIYLRKFNFSYKKLVLLK